MNILLLAFAIPVATILLAIVLQKILKCPLLVAATFFAILLIITFVIGNLIFLVFAIIYTILAYVTAILTKIICKLLVRFNLTSSCICCDDDDRRNNRRRDDDCNNRRNGRRDDDYRDDRSAYSVASGTWCCRTRDNPSQARINQIAGNAILSNNNCGCNNTNGFNDNDPVIVLTNAGQVISNARDGRNGRNGGCNCRCNRR